MTASTLDVYFNPFDPAFRADPYPSYRQLLKGPPRVLNLGLLSAVIVARYQEAVSILRDAARFSSRPIKIPGLEHLDPMRGAPTVLFSDPPAHTRLRRLVTSAFTPRRVLDLRVRVQAITDEILDHLGDRNEVDIMADLAGPLPTRVIAEMLGIPADDYAQFRAWSDQIIAVGTDLLPGMAPVGHSTQAISEIRAYLEQEIAKRRRTRTDDLIGALVTAQEDADALSNAELTAFVLLLLLGGNETTTNLIGNGLLALCRHPDQLERLKANPDLIDTAIDEMLRYDSPAQGTVRYSVSDAEIGGTEVAAGTYLLVLLAAANRDPAQFPDADRFDVARQPNEHLAFGEGIHFCIGAALARMEGATAINSLLRRFPRLHMKDPGRQMEYRSFFLHCLKQLPVELN